MYADNQTGPAMNPAAAIAGPDHRLQAGITLVEVMVAVLILSMTLGGGISAVTTFSRAAEAARRRTEAVHTARSTLEILAKQSFSGASLAMGTHALAGGAAGSYQVTTVPAGNPFSSRRQVEVSVQWTYPGTGQVLNETLTTIVSEALRP